MVKNAKSTLDLKTGMANSNTSHKLHQHMDGPATQYHNDEEQISQRLSQLGYLGGLPVTTAGNSAAENQYITPILHSENQALNEYNAQLRACEARMGWPVAREEERSAYRYTEPMSPTQAMFSTPSANLPPPPLPPAPKFVPSPRDSQDIKQMYPLPAFPSPQPALDTAKDPQSLWLQFMKESQTASHSKQPEPASPSMEAVEAASPSPYPPKGRKGKERKPRKEGKGKWKVDQSPRRGHTAAEYAFANRQNATNPTGDHLSRWESNAIGQTKLATRAKPTEHYSWAFPTEGELQAEEHRRQNLMARDRFPKATRKAALEYCKPFCEFLTDNPTVFHAVSAGKQQLKDAGFTELDERKKWSVEAGGSYFVERNGSALIAFVVGEQYEPGNGAAIIAGHVDALTAKLKPVSEVPNKAGYLQLGVAPYAGGLNSTWWDRDLGIGGRVLVKEGDKIVTKLVKLAWPIARIPTLAPHFGAAANGPFNPETQMVPIIGLDGTDSSATDVQTAQAFSQPPILGGAYSSAKTFVSKQPPALVKIIGDAIGLETDTYSTIVNWELELFDLQPATVGGLNKEFIFGGRIDDKLCSWSAMQALLESAKSDTANSSIVKIVGWFDNEEIGSLLRQGARSNFLPQTIERAVGALGAAAPSVKYKKRAADYVGRTYANSFLVSADVTHAVNPNFLNAYLENHAPHLNVGLCVSADPNGHMTTDAVSTAILQRCAEKVDAKLQVFQIRNDSRSGGTVGPMLSSMTGIRSIDAGIPQLSMHSIRATTGALDPGLGVLAFLGFLNGFEEVDKEFQG